MVKAKNVMINLQPLLKYQEIDEQLREIYKAVESHEDSISLKKVTVSFNKAKQVAQDSMALAGKLVKFCEKATQDYEDAYKKIMTLSDKLESLPQESDKERKEIVAELNALKDSLIALEKKVIECRTTSESVIRNYQKANQTGKKVSAEKAELSAKVKEVEVTYKSQIEEKIKQRDEIGKDVDPKLLTRYKKIISDKKNRAVVEVKVLDGGKSYGCSGCGMTLDPKSKNSIDDETKGVCICENCRRIVYKETK